MSTKKYFKKFVKSLIVPKSLLEIKLKILVNEKLPMEEATYLFINNCDNF